MNLLVLLAVFAAPVLVGAAMGAYTFWLPRHRLNRIFAEARRLRLAGVSVSAVCELAAA